MVNLGPLFEAAAAVAARDQGLALVSRNAGPAFMEAAKALIVEQFSGQELLAEELRRACEDAGILPHHHNAWGSLTNHLVRAGILQDTGRIAKSTRLSSHARRNTVWRVRG